MVHKLVQRQEHIFKKISTGLDIYSKDFKLFIQKLMKNVEELTIHL